MSLDREQKETSEQHDSHAAQRKHTVSDLEGAKPSSTELLHADLRQIDRCETRKEYMREAGVFASTELKSCAAVNPIRPSTSSAGGGHVELPVQVASDSSCLITADGRHGEDPLDETSFKRLRTENVGTQYFSMGAHTDEPKSKAKIPNVILFSQRGENRNGAQKLTDKDGGDDGNEGSRGVLAPHRKAGDAHEAHEKEATRRIMLRDDDEDDDDEHFIAMRRQSMDRAMRVRASGAQGLARTSDAVMASKLRCDSDDGDAHDGVMILRHGGSNKDTLSARHRSHKQAVRRFMHRVVDDDQDMMAPRRKRNDRTAGSRDGQKLDCDEREDADERETRSCTAQASSTCGGKRCDSRRVECDGDMKRQSVRKGGADRDAHVNSSSEHVDDSGLLRANRVACAWRRARVSKMLARWAALTLKRGFQVSAGSLPLSLSAAACEYIFVCGLGVCVKV
jgi:hypothetical protein